MSHEVDGLYKCCVAYQVLIDDAIACREKGQDVGDEVLLLVLQRLPVLQVLRQVDLE